MVYEIEYERPRFQSDYWIARGYTEQYTFIVPLFDLELHGYFRMTQQQYLEKSEKTFDYLPGTAKESKQRIRYYGVKYTILLPKERPSPEQFIAMVERYVKDRFYTLKYLGEQVYLIDPINKTNDFYRQRYTEIIRRKKQDNNERKRKIQQMEKHEEEEIRGVARRRRRRRWRSRSKSPPPRDRPLKSIQKLKL